MMTPYIPYKENITAYELKKNTFTSRFDIDHTIAFLIDIHGEVRYIELEEWCIYEIRGQK
ncbi:MAG: hypothetical protein QF551_07070 [Candidatus Marinimicrobia bacterium]|jgi:predicted component of type VI protein secretion system|nr:hypothetical protein [Candidatus Neomarinimicrobiota bacterium]MDP6836998.1 hypothetical protein [Candidatus Neomarinimicrobiota bacterium]MDP6967016.1 hypothetical protein [Candidatus Neomarinimicrobiota bacterium]|tara:strand:- start:117 stop:296 length:180 start_codon:yes stop_codon:yes gene_type:complete